MKRVASASTDYRKKRLAFRLSAIVLGLLPFFIAEVVLRAVNYPPASVRTDPLLDCSQLEPLFQLSEDDVYRIPPERMRLFAPAEFKKTKPPNTSRVFALGGSTTQGEPYGPPTAFPAWFGINLKLVQPDRHWEVINCGGLSYASYRVLPILREVLEYDPDLIILYCGQNEFLEARELSGWKAIPISVQRTLSGMSRIRLVQAIASAIPDASDAGDEETKTRLKSEVDALLDARGGLEKYHRGTLDAEGVVASYRWNMRQMVEACQARKVPLLLMVPTVNLRDCPPFKIEPDPKLSENQAKRLDELWRQVQADREEVVSVRPLLEEIVLIDPQHAGAHYILGQLAISEKDWTSARRHLTAAKDCDVCPLRAPSVIQGEVREIASQYRVPLLDADAIFEARSPEGLVGRQWLIDHIHPTIEGHQLLGEALAELWIEHAAIAKPNDDWHNQRKERYREHLGKLGEDYFIRGKQRLEGLMLWTQGRAKQMGVEEP